MIDSVTNGRDQIAFFAFHSFFVKVETKANLRASSPFGGVARSHARAARERRRECFAHK